MLPNDTFADRVALVTGGGSGIGRAIALQLAAKGASVALVGRRQEKLAEVQAEARKVQPNGDHTIHPLDVRDRTAVETAVGELVARHGQINHLVNSAAGNFRANPEDLSPNAWDAVVQIVQYGTWNFTQTVGRHMLERGDGGSILNIGSNMARNGGPDTVHSASAKAAVTAMTKSLAAAWGPNGIRVNVLIPDLTSGTAGAEILYGEQEITDEIPLRRMVAPAEVADAATFLLSDYAGYITGAELVVDGGKSLGQV